MPVEVSESDMLRFQLAWTDQRQLLIQGALSPFGDVATYRAVSEQMLCWGGGIDAGMLYFDVRLSERYPTVEIRVADVCTDVEPSTGLPTVRGKLEATAWFPSVPW